MPDPQRKTISATEVAALFDASPYVTRFMLWHRFANGLEIDGPEDSRMSWGRKLQPLVLAQAAEDLRLEVRPNEKNTYVSRGQFGCTRDAEIYTPDRGLGSLETKCVFDYGVWMRDWNGGKIIPRQNEIQLQEQMMVGNGINSYTYGVFGVWVCGEMHYYDRDPMPELWEEFQTRGRDFFASLTGAAPDPFGAPVEVPLLSKLFDPPKDSVLDLTGSPVGKEIAEAVRMFEWHKTERGGHDKAAETMKAKLLAVAGQNEQVILPYGINYKLKARNVKEHMRAASKSVTVTPYVPEGLEEGYLPVVHGPYAGDKISVVTKGQGALGTFVLVDKGAEQWTGDNKPTFVRRVKDA